MFQVHFFISEFSIECTSARFGTHFMCFFSSQPDRNGEYFWLTIYDHMSKKIFKNARKQFHTLPYIYVSCSFEGDPTWNVNIHCELPHLSSSVCFSPIAYELNVICKWRLWACLNRVSRCVVNPSTVGRNCLYSYQFLLLHPDLLFCARLYKCKCPSAFWISRDRIDLTRVMFACGPIILPRLQWE